MNGSCLREDDAQPPGRDGAQRDADAAFFGPHIQRPLLDADPQQAGAAVGNPAVCATHASHSGRAAGRPAIQGRTSSSEVGVPSMLKATPFSPQARASEHSLTTAAADFFRRWYGKFSNSYCTSVTAVGSEARCHPHSIALRNISIGVASE
jgi:hypothetical protein